MQPLTTGPRRKGLRRARKGIRTGRRTTHAVRTAYGKGQAWRDHLARWPGGQIS